VNWGDIATFVFFFLVVAVPILGLTARFALAPLLRTLAALTHSFYKQRDTALLERRMLALEDALRQVHRELARLAETRDFDRELAAPREPDRSLGD
jgi:hypothetical protein